MKKSLIIGLVLAVLTSMLCIPIRAAAAVSVWDGTIPSSIPTSPYAGSGTKDSPYIISSAAELAVFALQVNSGVSFYKKYVRLVCDIDLNNKLWQPIGGTELAGCYFDGEFDGNHHTITNLNVATEKSQAGFFGSIGGAVIKNLGIESGSVSGGNYTGGIAGYLFDSSEIINCYNNTDVYSKCLTDNATAGGIIGGAVDKKNLLIADCVNNGDISAESDAEHYARVGGIIGAALGADSTRELNNCYNTGEVTLVFAKNNINTRAGGLAGGFMNNAKVEKCVSTGKVTILLTPSDACRAGILIGSFASHNDGTKNVGTFYECKYVAIAGLNVVTYPAAELVSGASAVDSFTIPRQNSAYGFIYYSTPDDSLPASAITTSAPETITPPVTTQPVTSVASSTAITPETSTEIAVTTAVTASTTADTTSSGGCGSSFAGSSMVLFVGFASFLIPALTKRKK